MNAIWQLVITYLAGPHITHLLNGTAHISFIPENFINIQSISFVLASITVGLAAVFQVRRAQDKTTKIGLELKEAEVRATRDIATVYEKSTELQEKIQQQAKLEIESWKSRVEEERKNSDKLLQSEREKFNAERDKLASACQWLFDELSHARDKKTQSGEKFYFTSDKVQKTRFYSLDAIFVDDRTPGEKRFGEIEAMLKKYKG